jgi:hypothetical protein
MVHTMTVRRIQKPLPRDSAGGQVPAYDYAWRDVPCCILEDYSRLYDQYLQRDEEEQSTIWLLDKKVYEDVRMEDVVQAIGKTYRVYAKHDVGNQGRVFRVQVKKTVDID